MVGPSTYTYSPTAATVVIFNTFNTLRCEYIHIYIYFCVLYIYYLYSIYVYISSAMFVRISKVNIGGTRTSHRIP